MVRIDRMVMMMMECEIEFQRRRMLRDFLIGVYVLGVVVAIVCVVFYYG